MGRSRRLFRGRHESPDACFNTGTVLEPQGVDAAKDDLPFFEIGEG